MSQQILMDHVVVLIRCHPNYLLFMNSWGEDFVDGGFFRVRDENVFHKMEFFDVYWEEDDLLPSEIDIGGGQGERRPPQM